MWYIAYFAKFQYKICYSKIIIITAQALKILNFNTKFVIAKLEKEKKDESFKKISIQNLL